MSASEILSDLQILGSQAKATHLSRFFKTGKGEYGEGDQFIGVTVPEQRTIAKKYKDTDFPALTDLIHTPFHEARLTALLILVGQFEKNKNEAFRKDCVDFYLANTRYINNWDLVDLSCYKLLGVWLEDKKRDLLYRLAVSDLLWEQRISMVSCMHFVRKGDYKDCLALADSLLHHSHDLMHKAVGWLLRETGKKDCNVLKAFLQTRYQDMPRTMLRYAIEHFPEEERKRYLNNAV